MPHILLVEDEPAIADTLIYALTSDGMQVSHVGLGQSALARCGEAAIDLVILDVGLPDMSGFDVCKTLRRTSETPVLFLTARADEIDRVVGLEIGGDDYVTKPFSPREVVARVKAILKRTRTSASTEAPRQSWFEVDDARCRVLFCGQVLDLTRYEYLLLKQLLAHPERVYPRGQLFDLVWGLSSDSLDRTVDAHVKSLRAKLRLVRADLNPIQTHRGLGYSIREQA